MNKNKAILFTKMSGHGNDFIVIDNRGENLSIDWSEKACSWCRRRGAVGADGILLVEKSNIADFKMKIFNADGSEAEMCGNGARCVAAFAARRKIARQRMTFETLAGIIEADVKNEDVSIKLTEPVGIKDGITLNIGDVELPAFFVNSGVPHTVVFKDNVAEVPEEEIKKTGRMIRFHFLFQPAGTNVDFVEILGPGRIRVRTYERGVEEETLACGTGAVAASIITSKFKNIGNPPVRVEMPGGTLSVTFKSKKDNFEDVWLSGKVDWIFNGEIIDD
jgi:diaminopimelate epimerase